MSKFIVETTERWGKYRAEVLDINDPLKRGRVKVKCESIMPNKPELGWAESCLPAGIFTLPRVGDYVWIEFEGGDIALPIWVGIMPTRAYVKEFIFEGFSDRINYDHLVAIFKTTHHRVVFKNNDLKGNKHIEITDNAGSKILFNGDTGDINISANDNLSQVAGNTISNSQGGVEDFNSPPVPKPILPRESEQ